VSAASPTRRTVYETLTSRFRGSDDDLRARFEEYICGALSSLKLADFKAKSAAGGVTVTGAGASTGAGPESAAVHFSEAWLDEYRQTRAYEEWAACTDPILFDLYEPKHPCEGAVNAVSDLGLRLTGESDA
jgi:hypothetical protein